MLITFKHNNARNLTSLGSVSLEGLRMTDYVETCRHDIYTFVYKINVVLLTGVQYLFAYKNC